MDSRDWKWIGIVGAIAGLLLTIFATALFQQETRIRDVEREVWRLLERSSARPSYPPLWRPP